jgi:transposase
MPTERLPMRKIRDVLRLKFANGLSEREIAGSLRIGHSTAGEFIRRARAAGLSWPLPEGMNDTELELRVYPKSEGTKAARVEAAWASVHVELRRPDVTLMLLWTEYRTEHPEGFSYSRFAELYRAVAKTVSPTMRQVHVAGKKLFVDYAGRTAEVIDPLTGEVHAAQVFVATLGASNYTYAEATWTQSLADWVGSHMRCFSFMGGVSRQLVCDNLKAGITKASFYEPLVNRSYLAMAAHYGTAVQPARPFRARDKAIVSYCTLFC